MTKSYIIIGAYIKCYINKCGNTTTTTFIKTQNHSTNYLFSQSRSTIYHNFLFTVIWVNARRNICVKSVKDKQLRFGIEFSLLNQFKSTARKGGDNMTLLELDSFIKELVKLAIEMGANEMYIRKLILVNGGDLREAIYRGWIKPLETEV
jgi:hypothetical protein